MPRYKIAGSYGYVGTDWSDEVEADNEEEAYVAAQERALEKVDYWCELIPEETAEEGHEA